MNAYEQRDVVELTWSNKSAGDDQAPSTDSIIDLRQVESLCIQVDTTHTSHTSTGVDVNLIRCLDGTNWDTVSEELIASVADNKVQSTVVVDKFAGDGKLRLDVADGAAYVTVRLKKRCLRAS